MGLTKRELTTDRTFSPAHRDNELKSQAFPLTNPVITRLVSGSPKW
jgi:hypothetical protein